MNLLRYCLQWLCLFLFGILLSRQHFTGVVLSSFAIATGWIMMQPIVGNQVAKTSWSKAFLWLPGVLHLKKRGFEFNLDGAGIVPLIKSRILFGDSIKLTAHNFHRHKAWNRLPYDAVTFRSPNESLIRYCIKQKKLTERFRDSNNLPPLIPIPEDTPHVDEKVGDACPLPNNSPNHPLFASDF